MVALLDILIVKRVKIKRKADVEKMRKLWQVFCQKSGTQIPSLRSLGKLQEVDIKQNIPDLNHLWSKYPDIDISIILHSKVYTLKEMFLKRILVQYDSNMIRLQKNLWRVGSTMEWSQSKNWQRRYNWVNLQQRAVMPNQLLQNWAKSFLRLRIVTLASKERDAIYFYIAAQFRTFYVTNCNTPPHVHITISIFTLPYLPVLTCF